MAKMEFKDILRMLRIEKGLTQAELGSLVNLKKEAIYKYEKGIVVNPKRDLIAKFANIFNVSPSYLLGISETRMVLKDDFTEYEKCFIVKIRSLNEEGIKILEENLDFLLSKDRYKKESYISA